MQANTKESASMACALHNTLHDEWVNEVRLNFVELGIIARFTRKMQAVSNYGSLADPGERSPAYNT
jgi:hypothetical protein